MNIPSQRRIIIPKIIVTIAGFGVGVLARKAQRLGQTAGGLGDFAEGRLLGLPDHRLVWVGQHLGSAEVIGDHVVGLRLRACEQAEEAAQQAHEDDQKAVD